MNFNWISNIFSTKVLQNNEKSEQFEELSKDDLNVLENSVISQYFKNQYDSFLGTSTFQFLPENTRVGVETSKGERLRQYRTMSFFPEVGDAIDDICDNALQFDEYGNIISLVIKNDKIDGMIKEELENSFKEYISLFNLEVNLFEFMRRFVIEGELAWENVTMSSVEKEKNKKLTEAEEKELDRENGIIGINFIEPECYDFAVNVKNGKKEGLAISTKNTTFGNRAGNTSFNSIQGGIGIQNLNVYDSIVDKKSIFMPWNQLTYINTGIYSLNRMYVIPVLERARKAYNQLALIEDAIIIYRLVRAPERYVFNVDVGKIPRPRAEQEIKKMMQAYTTKKVYNPATGSIANNYDVHQLLESFWFPRSQGSEGTTVSTIGGQMNLGQLEDLNYFLRKLYISLKIPWTRYFNENQSEFKRDETISYDEFRFSKFVMRLQNCFSSGLCEGFKSHLKLKGLWDQYNLTNYDFILKFTPPSSFTIYEQQKMLELKVSNYTKLSENEEFSKELCMKDYLGWTTDKIAENRKMIEEEMKWKAKLEYITNNLKEKGIEYPVEKSNLNTWTPDVNDWENWKKKQVIPQTSIEKPQIEENP